MGLSRAREFTGFSPDCFLRETVTFLSMFLLFQLPENEDVIRAKARIGWRCFTPDLKAGSIKFAFADS